MSIRQAPRLSRVIFPCLAMLCLSMRLAAQDLRPGAEQVLKLEEKWTAAYKERDLDLMSNLLTEDFIITVEDGSTYSKAGYITHTADPTTQVEVAEQSDMHVRMRAGVLAIVTGAYHERGHSKNKPYEYHDRFTDVWVRAGNGWRVLSSHYSTPIK